MREPLTIRLYRWMLSGAPAPFRAVYEHEAVTVLGQLLMDERALRGAWIAHRTWLRAMIDAWRVVRRERAAQSGPRSPWRDGADDVRHGLRRLARWPGQTAALVGILALGVGANGAVFSILRAVLLQPLPYRAPDRVAMVWTTPKHPPADPHDLLRPATVRSATSSDEAIAVHDQSRGALADTATYLSWQGNLEATFDLLLDNRVERLRGVLATPNFFELLGVSAARGRVFTTADATGVEPTLVISDALWHRAFGADPTVVGRQLTLLAGRTRQPTVFTIIGVLPSAFRFTYPDETEVWSPYSWAQVRAQSGRTGYWTVARLADGVTRDAADARVAAIPTNSTKRKLEEQYQRRFTLQPITEWVVGETRPALLLLSAVAVILLVVTCATVASALFVRTTARQSELAVRAALGAERGRLVRQLLTEGVILAIAGAAIGTVVAAGLSPVLRALLPPAMPRGDEVTVDWWMLAFFAGTAGVVTLLATVAPAWRGSRLDIVVVLKRGSTTVSADRTTARWRRALVGAQAAMATSLLLASVLLLVSYWRLSHMPLGFDGTRVLTVEMRLLTAKYFPPPRSTPGPPMAVPPSPALLAFQDRLIAGVRSVPGVVDAGLTSAVPFRGVDFTYVLNEKGRTRTVLGRARFVDAGYFSTLEVPIRRGRVFGVQDTATSPRVVVVSESYARQMFGDADPMGRVIEGQTDLTVVGVVADLRYEAFDKDPTAAIYLPRSQSPNELICVVARLAPNAGDVATAVRRLVRQIDPEVPAMNLTTIDHILSSSTSDRRFYTTATTTFAILALALAMAGLIVVVSRAVVEQRRELAIRAALGAQEVRLLGLVVRQGMLPAIVGAATGLTAVWVFARVLDGFLFHVTPRAPWAYGGVAVIVLASALGATLLPARRAIRLPPAATLRAE